MNNYLKYFLIFIASICILGLFFIGEKVYQYKKNVNNGVYSITKTKQDFFSKINSAIKYTVFCDINPEDNNPNCIKSQNELDDSMISLLKLNYLIKNQCPDYIFQYSGGQISGLLIFLSYNHSDRYLKSMQFYNENIYEALTNTVEDLVNFNFQESCPDSIEMEGQNASQ